MTEFCYDDTDVHRRYDAARELPRATMALWMDTLVARVGRTGVRRIADICCGTGRFGEALADVFSASVVGIDVSQKMLARARLRRPSRRLCFVRGSAERLLLGDALLVWTSNLDGALGTGDELIVADLSPGVHTVTVTATDADFRK